MAEATKIVEETWEPWGYPKGGPLLKMMVMSDELNQSHVFEDVNEVCYSPISAKIIATKAFSC